MQILFDISAAILVIHFLVKWFEKAIPPALDPTRRRSLLYVFYCGIVFKLGIVVAWYLYVGGHEFNETLQDAYVYDWGGQYLSLKFKDLTFFNTGLPVLLGGEYCLGYYYVLGLLYTIFGHYHIVPSIFNAFASIATCILIYRICVRLFDANTARWALILNLFYPQYASMSYFILKDVFLTFIVVFAVWIAVSEKRWSLKLIITTLAISCLYTFRPQLAIVFFILVFVQVALSELSEPRRGKALLNALAVSSVLALILFFVSTDISEIGISTEITPHGSDETGLVGLTRLTFTFDSFSQIAQIVTSMPVQFVTHSIDSVMRTFYGPFYLVARGGPNLRVYDPDGTIFRCLLESLSGMVTGLMMPMIVTGVIDCFVNRRRETFILYGSIVVVVLALILFGIETRWRLPIIPFVLIFGAVGLTQFRYIKPYYIFYFLLYNIIIAANISWNDSLVVAIPLTIVTVMGVFWGLCHNNRILGAR